MEFIIGIGTVLLLIVVFMLCSMAFTFPSWVLGFLTPRQGQHMKATVVTNGPARRWLAWGLSSMAVIFLISELVENGLGTVRLLLVAGFCVLAQFFAYVLGSAARHKRMAHSRPEVYSSTGQVVLNERLVKEAEEAKLLQLSAEEAHDNGDEDFEDYAEPRPIKKPPPPPRRPLPPTQ